MVLTPKEYAKEQNKTKCVFYLQTNWLGIAYQIALKFDDPFDPIFRAKAFEDVSNDLKPVK